MQQQSIIPTPTRPARAAGPGRWRAPAMLAGAALALALAPAASGAQGAQSGTAAAVAARPPAAAGRPNVVLILTDDLGYGQLGYTGNKVIKTPNIDRLAARGIEFTQAYAGGPVCSPSRIALLTGRDARAARIDSNAALLQPGDRTVAHLLRDAGYRTALFGKFGVGLTFGKTDPMAMGFTDWVGLMHNVSAHRQYPPFVYRNNVVEAVGGNTAGAKGVYAQRLFTDEALKFLDTHDASRPFFMMLSYTSPHAELAAPDSFVAPYRGRFPETPWKGLGNGADGPGYPKYYPEPVAQPAAVLAGMVSALDAYIGEVVAKLEAKGIADNTIIVFTSDNGGHMEGGAIPAATNAGGPYRGTKRDLYEGGIHEPMLVVWPRQIRQPRKDDTPWTFADFLPTVAGLAGVPQQSLAASGVNGVSIAPRLRDGAAAMPERTLYWVFRAQLGDPNSTVLGAGEQAARRGWTKAVRRAGKAVEIYDLRTDPGEQRDLARARPDEALEFTRYFDTLMRAK